MGEVLGLLSFNYRLSFQQRYPKIAFGHLFVAQFWHDLAVVWANGNSEL